MITYTTTIHMSKGYLGKEAAYSKGYIARITGSDSAGGLRREFLQGKPDSSETLRQGRCKWNDAYELEPGLYELSEGGERHLWVVLVKNGEAKHFTVQKDRALAMARLMDEGETFDEARRHTKKAAQ